MYYKFASALQNDNIKIVHLVMDILTIWLVCKAIALLQLHLTLCNLQTCKHVVIANWISISSYCTNDIIYWIVYICLLDTFIWVSLGVERLFMSRYSFRVFISSIYSSCLLTSFFCCSWIFISGTNKSNSLI